MCIGGEVNVNKQFLLFLFIFSSFLFSFLFYSSHSFLFPFWFHSLFSLDRTIRSELPFLIVNSNIDVTRDALPLRSGSYVIMKEIDSSKVPNGDFPNVTQALMHVTQWCLISYVCALKINHLLQRIFWPCHFNFPTQFALGGF